MRRWPVILLLAVAILAAAMPVAARREGVVVSIPEEPATWRERAALVMDHGSLGPALRENGYYYAGNDEIYMAEIVDGVGQPAMILYDAVQGAFSQNFWPASSVKALASVAALEYLASLGYAGDDVVTASWLGERTVRSIYEPAITRSDNHAYDLLVRIAGVDFINLEFAPRNQLGSVTIGSDLSGLSVLYSPSYTLSRWLQPDELPPVRRWGPDPILATRTVPARSASRYYRSNNADLFDLGEVVRRVMLHGEIPESQRFDLEEADVAGLREALCSYSPAHYTIGARRAFGEDALVCGKSGWWDRRPPNEEEPAEGEGDEDLEPSCTDVALISDPNTGTRVLLAATGGCFGGGLAALAGPALQAAADLRGTRLQEDSGIPIEVALGAGGGMLDIEITTDAWWALVTIDDEDPVVASRRGDHLHTTVPLPAEGRHLLVVEGIDFGVPVGYRAVDFEVSGA